MGPSNKSTQYGGIFFQIVDLPRAVDVLKLNQGKVVYVGVSEKLYTKQRLQNENEIKIVFLLFSISNCSVVYSFGWQIIERLFFLSLLNCKVEINVSR